MNFMGMGVLELGAILVVALLVLGPNRMVEVARTIGKYMRELQRATAELPRLFSLDDVQPKTPPPQRQQLPDQPYSKPQDSVEAEQPQAAPPQEQQLPDQPAEEQRAPASKE